VEKFSSGAWTEHTPAVRYEAARLLHHVAQHHGRINITDPGLGFRPVTLDHLPDGWATQASQITTEWKPPTGRPE